MAFIALNAEIYLETGTKIKMFESITGKCNLWMHLINFRKCFLTCIFKVHFQFYGSREGLPNIKKWIKKSKDPNVEEDDAPIEKKLKENDDKIVECLT